MLWLKTGNLVPGSFFIIIIGQQLVFLQKFFEVWVFSEDVSKFPDILQP